LWPVFPVASISLTCKSALLTLPPKKQCLINQSRVTTVHVDSLHSAGAAQQAAVTAAVPQKAASSTGAGRDRCDGTYRGQICAQTCRPVTVTVKQGAVSGSWFSGVAGKRAYVKGTIAPECAVKLALEAFDGKGRPITGAMTGTRSGDTITTSGTRHHNGVPVKATWTRGP
jgi:hypothetical protein